MTTRLEAELYRRPPVPSKDQKLPVHGSHIHAALSQVGQHKARYVLCVSYG